MLRDRLFFGRKTASFTLQWHLTNACEASCLHCYDRSQISILDIEVAKRIARDFISFCRQRAVKGQICLTGGNPILYPDFFELYSYISSCGIPISILGNPISGEALSQLVSIQTPVYYQVSLEGLPEHNDAVRGQGHFERVIQFLGQARKYGIHSYVMLTLTRANTGQVIPLAERLRGLADNFTFNRLSQVGEGSKLALPQKEEFIEFMRQYIIASRDNPILGFKDNLFNIFRYHYRRKPARGCTGFGCGAAFNFVALLPNGEVHACRKFPSMIGSVLEDKLDVIYNSRQAKQYRRGCRRCAFCPIRRHCGGCLAVSYSQGYDAFSQRDPYCFMAEREKHLNHSW